MAGFASYTAKSVMRPDIVAGPIERKCTRANGSLDVPAWPESDDDDPPSATARSTAQRVKNRRCLAMDPPGSGVPCPRGLYDSRSEEVRRCAGSSRTPRPG